MALPPVSEALWRSTAGMSGAGSPTLPGKGARVRLRPRAGGDVFDLVLIGKAATVDSIEQDLEGNYLGEPVAGVQRVLGAALVAVPQLVEPVGVALGLPGLVGAARVEDLEKSFAMRFETRSFSFKAVPLGASFFRE